MSRKLVRHVTADWFNSAQIKGLDKVHPGKPREIPWADYGTGPYLCQGYVLVERRQRKRIALGGPTNGQKDLDSTVRLVLWFHTSETDWLEAQDAFDDVTESVVKQLEAGGRVLGRADVIVSAGEFGGGITQTDEEPVALDGGVMETRCEIEFQVTEVINA